MQCLTLFWALGLLNLHHQSIHDVTKDRQVKKIKIKNNHPIQIIDTHRWYRFMKFKSFMSFWILTLIYFTFSKGKHSKVWLLWLIVDVTWLSLFNTVYHESNEVTMSRPFKHHNQNSSTFQNLENKRFFSTCVDPVYDSEWQELILKWRREHMQHLSWYFFLLFCAYFPSAACWSNVQLVEVKFILTHNQTVMLL